MTHTPRMQEEAKTWPKAGPFEAGLAQVRARMARVAEALPFGAAEEAVSQCLEGGKMLRARLVLRMAPSCGATRESALRSAAAVEMVHAASLLHDDVIDGGRLRRSAPAFWVQHGVQAAILIGDLLLSEASRQLEAKEDERQLRELLLRTREVCRAEVEQELVLRGQPADWDTAVRLARQKTGALFAFSAVAACGTEDEPAGLRSALREAGYLAGTAYQLSDDVLDVAGDAGFAGKTLGRDSEREKITAGSIHAADPAVIVAELDHLHKDSTAHLARYSTAASAWREYWEKDLGPVLDGHLHCPTPTPVPSV